MRVVSDDCHKFALRASLVLINEGIRHISMNIVSCTALCLYGIPAIGWKMYRKKQPDLFLITQPVISVISPVISGAILLLKL